MYSHRISAIVKRLLLCAAAGLLLSAGCMHRRMTIRSDPPQALVLVDGEEIGYTPVSMDHTYYGTREFTLIKPGYETLTVLQKIRTPWYQIIPIDFVTDNFWPFKITDRNEFHYSLQETRPIGNQELIDRARSYRDELRQSP